MQGNLTEITSPSNSRLKLARSLSGRNAIRKSGVFLMEGPLFINDYIDSRESLPSFLVLSEEGTSSARSTADRALEKKIEVLLVSSKLFKDLSDTEHSQGVAAVCPLPGADMDQVAAGYLVLLLDGVSDPGNMGTAIRSAAAFGCSGVVCGRGSCYPFIPRVTRAAVGTNTKIPIIHGVRLPETLKQLKDRGYQILGADSAGKSIVEQDIPGGPVALAIGSETHGLSDEILKQADILVAIPMKDDIESLNASVSASIILFVLSQRTI